MIQRSETYTFDMNKANSPSPSHKQIRLPFPPSMLNLLPEQETRQPHKRDRK